MFYTPHLRNFTTVNTPIIFVGAGPADMVVPPKQERFFLTRKCTIEPLCEDTSDDLMRAATSRQYTCADLKDYCDLQSRIKAACPKTCGACNVPRRPVNVISAFFHAHLLGREMYTVVYRNGTVIFSSADRLWHYDDQYNHNVEEGTLQLREGDEIQTTCVYNSNDRSVDTIFGQSTYEEMCINTLGSIHPTAEAASFNDGAFWCTGNVWDGALAPQEDVVNLATFHPEEDADNVWSGISLRAVTRDRPRPSLTSGGCGARLPWTALGVVVLVGLGLLG
jgi:hypothetical protein